MPLTLSGSGAINGLTLPTDSLQPGLVLVNTTTFSAAASVSVNNCFTSAYKNYKILWDLDPTANVTTLLRLRASGADNTSANYWYGIAVGNYATGGSTTGASGQTSWQITSTDAGTSPSWGSMDLMGPQVAENSAYLGLTAYSQAAGSMSGGFFNSAQFDGFTFFPQSGTITGSLRVYGYRNS